MPINEKRREDANKVRMTRRQYLLGKPYKNAKKEAKELRKVSEAEHAFATTWGRRVRESD